MRVKFAAILAMLVLALAPWASAQSGKGTITGRVTDPSGGVVPGAKVAVINTETGVRFETLTNGEGYFEAQALIPSLYDVEVTAPNFKTLIRKGVTVQVEDRIALDLKLDVGQVSESITITSEAPQLRTEDAEAGEVITSTMIQTLPSNNPTGLYRDPFLLLILSGDVQGSGARAGTGLDIAGGKGGESDTRINGGRTASIEYLVDGVPVTSNIGHNVSVSTPGYDDVAEFKVVTNGISAEYGRLSGGAVSITTKGGTNGLHGQIFEYHQDAFLNANTWDNNWNKAKKANFRTNDFGFAVGGPVVLPHLYNGRQKTFWFVNYEGVRNSSSGNIGLAGLPTPAERTGDFTDLGVGLNDPNAPWAQIWDPFAGSSYPTLVTPSGGNPGYQRTNLVSAGTSVAGRVIPTNELDPTALAYMALLPAPNRPALAGSASTDNFQYFQPNFNRINLWSMRIDHNFNDRHRLFFRFGHTEFTGGTGPVFNTPAFTSTSNETVVPGGWTPTLGYDWNISSTTLLELRVGGNYSPYGSGSFLPGNFNNSNLHYSPQILSLLGSSRGFVSLTGIDTESQTFDPNHNGIPGLGGESGYKYNSTSAQYSAMLTKVLGRHSVKFGYEGRRYYDNFYNNGGTTMFVDAEAVGPYSNNDQSWGPQGDANGLGQLLLGVDSWLQIAKPYERAYRTNYYASFVQDDFKVTPRLTLNLGLRWETESPITEKHNLLTVWDPKANPGFVVNSGYDFTSSLVAAGLNPSQIATPYWTNASFATGAIRIVGTPEHPSRNANDWHPWNFGPRLGAAYQITPRTVLRTSFSMLYLPTSGDLEAFASSPGINYTSQANSQPQQSLGLTVSVPQTGLQSLQMPFTQPSIQITTPTTSNLQANYLASSLGQTSSGAYSRYLHMPHEFDWSFGIQHQLPWNTLVEVNYQGNHSGTLLAKDTPSRFPSSLYTGGPGGTNAVNYNTQVTNPFAGQGPNNLAKISLGQLETLYPYFGLFQVQDVNAGTSNFHSLNVRLNKRFSDGLQVLFNYTYSRLLDDVGGSDSGLGAGPATGFGASGKTPQSIYNFKTTYGLDPSDQANRVSAFYEYQLPVGRGRKFLSSPEGVGGKLLDGAIGGWEISGDTFWNSGSPIAWNFQTNNQGGVGVFYQYATFASGKGLNDIAAAGYGGPSTARFTALNPTVKQAFNVNWFTPSTGIADPFTIGNVPPVFSKLRNPGNWNSNLSILKNFPVFSSDGKRYLQLRLEALNIFNHPGYGSYDSNLSHYNSTFGMVTGTANTERHLQIAAKFVF
jgi:hypothetical protein